MPTGTGPYGTARPLTTLGMSDGTTSLALDRSGNPRISYYGATDHDLKYAYWDGTVWNSQTVDNAGDVGQSTSLALDRSGNPRISYYDATDHDLKYAYWDGTVWNNQTVDNAGDVGEFSSLKLSTDGSPRIAYRDATNDDLKYAFEGMAPTAAFTAVPVAYSGQYGSGEYLGEFCNKFHIHNRRRRHGHGRNRNQDLFPPGGCSRHKERPGLPVYRSDAGTLHGCTVRIHLIRGPAFVA